MLNLSFWIEVRQTKTQWPPAPSTHTHNCVRDGLEKLRCEAAAACVKTLLNNSQRPLFHDSVTHLRQMFECDKYFSICLLNVVHSALLPQMMGLFSDLPTRWRVAECLQSADGTSWSSGRNGNGVEILMKLCGRRFTQKHWACKSLRRWFQPSEWG